MGDIQSVDSMILAGATVALVFVTIFLFFETRRYAKATADIVEEMRKDRVETQKDRRVQYIERRLEKLYYPIKRFELSPSPMASYHRTGQGRTEIAPSSFWDYQYLGSRELKNELETVRNLWINEPGSDLIRNCWSRIQGLVEKDISDMSKELDELI